MSEASRNGNKAAKQTRIDQRLKRLDSTNVKSSYAISCQVANTKEEIPLTVGLTHTKKRQTNNGQVPLANRIILSPVEAKRLAMFFKWGTFDQPEE